jgi:hypothetical protein
MSTQKPKSGDIELSKDELDAVVGGTLSIDGIDGESTDDKQKGTIQIESWSTGTKTTTKK